MASKRSRGGLLGRYRLWRARRRIGRNLREAGWPTSSAVFTGNVSLSEVVYAPGKSLADVVTDFDWQQQEC